MTNFDDRSGEGGWGAARADLRWSVTRLEGAPADLLAAGIPDSPRRLLRWCVPTSSALVLGSAQPPPGAPRDAESDGAPATDGALPIVRRRSGGASVLVAPGRLAWADVILPRDDPLWVEDVGRSSLWLGAVWVAALADLGITGAAVYRGAIQRSATVCFAGIAPGEVVVEGRKIVGISQRRTRAAALFQCAVLHSTTAEETAAVGIVDLLDQDVADAAVERAFEQCLQLV